MPSRAKLCDRLAKVLGVPAFLLLAGAHFSWATTYYVSCRGNDSNGGTSTSTPWATLSKASGASYAAGDQVGSAGTGAKRSRISGERILMQS
jgi:hypothetical protein